jgi:hypothetical protein
MKKTIVMIVIAVVAAKLLSLLFSEKGLGTFRVKVIKEPAVREMTRREKVALIRVGVGHGDALEKIAREVNLSPGELINFVQEEQDLEGVEEWLKRNMAEEIQEALRHADEWERSKE